jgi:hypothetical protein
MDMKENFLENDWSNACVCFSIIFGRCFGLFDIAG